MLANSIPPSPPPHPPPNRRAAMTAIFNVSSVVRDKVTRQCPLTNHNLFEEKREPKRYRAPWSFLHAYQPITPHRRWVKPAHNDDLVTCGVSYTYNPGGIRGFCPLTFETVGNHGQQPRSEVLMPCERRTQHSADPVLPHTHSPSTHH